MLTIDQQKSYHFSGTIAIDKPQAEVWELITDVSRWKDWDTELSASYLHEAFALGATGVLVPKKGPRLKFFISELVPGQSYTFNTKMPVGYLVIKRSLEYRDQATYFTDNVQLTGPLKRVFGLMLGRGFRASLPKVMENFKGMVEQHKQPML